MGGWSVVLPDADLAVPIATFESLAEVKALPEMPPQGGRASPPGGRSARGSGGSSSQHGS